jgi:hypothetical protein
MVKKEKKTVEEILNILEPKQKETTQKLRLLINKCVPETVEIIRQKNITYTLNGKDFVWLTQAKDHVDLEFLMGAALDSDLLRSKGGKDKPETVRHVIVRDVERLEPELNRLLKDAARVGLEHCPSPAP